VRIADAVTAGRKSNWIEVTVFAEAAQAAPAISLVTLRFADAPRP